jgi:ABC-type sugar transport system ATPase subunit
MRGICVAFDSRFALDGVDFDVRPGEIVGLIGHNGAGKSTLIGAAAGSIRPHAGAVALNGQPLPLDSGPRARARAGIRVLHQDPALAGNLSIADNITLVGPGERAPRGARHALTRHTLAQLDIELNPERLVDTLAVAERQMVDLARAIAAPPSVLMLDEPTGTLGKRHTDRLHAILRSLASKGTAIVYVSHRMGDVAAVCSRVVVLREGHVVMRCESGNISAKELAHALSSASGSGREVHPAARGHEVLVVNGPGGRLSLHRGEILGLYGLFAGPQETLLRSLFGLDGTCSADLDGAAYRPRSPREAISQGVFYLPADRERDAVLPDMSARDNVALPWQRKMCRRAGISREATEQLYKRARETLRIYGPGPDAPLRAFSGGNRQKHALARWLFARDAKLLLLSQPTRGVDVGTRADIAAALRDATTNGVSVLVASSEADEVSLLCDRALVCGGPQWQEVPRTVDWEERIVEVLLMQHELR